MTAGIGTQDEAQPGDPADTARLPTQAAVHTRVRALLDAAGLHTRAERQAFMSEVLGREVRWPYEITGAESDLLITVLVAGVNEDKEERPS